jgi:hypothetical protein
MVVLGNGRRVLGHTGLGPASTRDPCIAWSVEFTEKAAGVSPEVTVVPGSYAGFFDASSQAAGALIGLLFVVIALKPGRIVGDRADPTSRRLAASSFTGLVNAFFVSLLALIPGHNIGIGAAIMAVLSLYHTLRLHLGYPGARHILVFVFSLLAYGAELFVAIAFMVHPHDRDLVTYLAFVLIGCFAVALSRAWQLMETTTANDLPAA